MGGDSTKKGEVKQKSSKEIRQLEGNQERRLSSSSSSERMQQSQSSVCGGESTLQQQSSTIQPPFQNIINNSSTVWNELFQEDGKGEMRTRHGADKQHTIPQCGYPSSSSLNNVSALPPSEIQETGKCNVSSSSTAFQHNNPGGIENDRECYITDTNDHDSISFLRTAAADEEYEQGFVKHISSDENEQLLPPEEHPRTDAPDSRNIIKKEGRGKHGGSKRQHHQHHAAKDFKKISSSSPPRRPSSLPIPIALIKDGKNASCERDLSLSSSHSFYIRCLSGISRALVVLCVASILLVTWLWFHTRISSLEREMGLQKEKMEILTENILAAERHLNRHPDFDPEEDDDDVEFDRGGGGSINQVNLIDPNRMNNQHIGHRLRKMLGKAQRVKRRVDSNQNQQQTSRSTNLANYNVEFLNPKLREEKDSRSGGGGGSSDKTAGSASESGSSVPEDEWVWLTSYSRIPGIEKVSDYLRLNFLQLRFPRENDEASSRSHNQSSLHCSMFHLKANHPD
ncbi:unnamed protein product [Orchesella dallaii]|uniref:Uncharacterized protein n=1 Tax=Orchesella dallaii TaxID=48710 RepID=A0ABP1QPP4_9HEXA